MKKPTRKKLTTLDDVEKRLREKAENFSTWTPSQDPHIMCRVREDRSFTDGLGLGFAATAVGLIGAYVLMSILFGR